MNFEERFDVDCQGFCIGRCSDLCVVGLSAGGKMIIEEQETRNGKFTVFRDFRGHFWHIETAPVFEERKLMCYRTTLKICIDRPKVKETINSRSKQYALQHHDGIVARLQRQESEDWKQV